MRVWKTRGGKYEIRLHDDGRVEYLTNGRANGAMVGGTYEEGEREVAKTIRLAARIDKRTYREVT